MLQLKQSVFDDLQEKTLKDVWESLKKSEKSLLKVLIRELIQLIQQLTENCLKNIWKILVCMEQHLRTKQRPGIPGASTKPASL